MHWRPLAGACLLTLATIAGGGAAEIPPDSPAQKALFDSDQLHNVTAPIALDYRFSRSGIETLSYDDKVVADIRTLHPEGGKDVWISFLSGDRQMPIPPVMNFHGNPLLMVFLEHDVNEMRDETGRPAALYRTLIRRALFDRARVTPTHITLAGREQPASEIVITPFDHEPLLTNIDGVPGKSYHFVLCDSVPGTLYQISSRLTLAQPGAVLIEAMTFTGTTP